MSSLAEAIRKLSSTRPLPKNQSLGLSSLPVATGAIGSTGLLSNAPAFTPRRASSNVTLSLEDILAKLGLSGVASYASRICHISYSHELWCRFLAKLLAGEPVSPPSTPMPPEFRELLKQLEASGVQRVSGVARRILRAVSRSAAANIVMLRKRVRKIVKKMAEAIREIMQGAKTHKAEHGIVASLQSLRNIMSQVRGEEKALQLIEKELAHIIKAQIKKPKAARIAVAAAVNAVRMVARGSEPSQAAKLVTEMLEKVKKPSTNASPAEAIKEMASMHHKSGNEREEKIKEIEEKMAKLAVIRLAGVPPSFLEKTKSINPFTQR